MIKNGNVTKQMCPTVDGVDFPSNVALSERHLLEGDNCFYVIGLGLPIVQAYSFDGRELARFNWLIFLCWSPCMQKMKI